MNKYGVVVVWTCGFYGFAGSHVWHIEAEHVREAEQIARKATGREYANHQWAKIHNFQQATLHACAYKIDERDFYRSILPI